MPSSISSGRSVCSIVGILFCFLLAGAPATQPAGKIVFQPAFKWAKGEPTHQGTGFFAKTPDGKIVGVTSAHFIDFDGPALLEATWLDVASDEPIATFSCSLGKPGNAGKDEPELDLRSDYLIFVCEKSPGAGVAVLELDDRAKPDLRERVWFPDKDPELRDGYRVANGTVVEVESGYVGVQLDDALKLQSQSGSPIVSRKTGKVIGTLSRGGEIDGKSFIVLAPSSGILKAMKSATTTPPVREVIGSK